MTEEQDIFPRNLQGPTDFKYYANIIEVAGPAASLKPLENELKTSETLGRALEEFVDLCAKSTQWQRKKSCYWEPDWTEPILVTISSTNRSLQGAAAIAVVRNKFYAQRKFSSELTGALESVQEELAAMNIDMRETHDENMWFKAAFK